jgi:hypothetical protein
MSVVAGGARDGAAPSEVWTKFTAEYVIGALGLASRQTGAGWLEQAEAGGRFLVQAARHGFSPRYRLDSGRWDSRDFGWDSWGRVVEACLLLFQENEETRAGARSALGRAWSGIQAPTAVTDYNDVQH